MKIKSEARDGLSVLHLSGDFDTFYGPVLIEEVEKLVQSGVVHVVLNMRLTKYVNSTGLGAIIKSSKLLKEAGGALVIAHPSDASRTAIEGVGLQHLIPLYGTEQEAVQHLFDSPEPPAQGLESFQVDQSTVLFSLVDEERNKQFLSRFVKKKANPLHGHKFGHNFRGVGQMSSVDENGLRFVWDGGATGIEPAQMGELLVRGVDLKVKFRLPLLIRGLHDALVTIEEVETRPDGVRVTASFKELADETGQCIRQYVKDMAYLKQELQQVRDQ